ncbi:dTDP-4-dehydrorhamnose 3,5-epimerase [Treponema sp.]|uniref:dTDP-4-dehydrorhamnose 3,5-epimerase n=1 Tax=Treponema sp. TaxID=166 RepID=UPI003F0EA83F
MFEFKKCFSADGAEFPGLYEILPKVFGDSRGYFLETYSERDFFDAGLKMKFVQDNQSASSRGVLRGLHFQKKHPQGKLVRALHGKVYDVAVDLRKESPAFGKYYGILLDSEKHNQFYIPEGFAHGFYVVSDAAVFAYKCTDFYHPEDEGGLMWNDSSIGIDWNAAGAVDCPILSEKDKNHPAFSFASDYFNIDGKWTGII